MAMVSLISTTVNFIAAVFSSWIGIPVHNFAILSYMKSLSPAKPHIIAVIGLPGSGKTFFAEKFSETFHAPYVDKEKLRSLTNLDEQTLDTVMNYQVDELLKTHQSLIVEGNTDTRTERAELNKKAREAGYETLFVWVQTDPAAAKGRAFKTAKERGATLSDNDYDHRVKRFAPPLASEKTVVISGRHTYASQAKVVLQRLSAPRAELSTHTTAPTRLDPTRRNITVR
jgi:predicted kinase